MSRHILLPGLKKIPSTKIIFENRFIEVWVFSSYVAGSQTEHYAVVILRVGAMVNIDQISILKALQIFSSFIFIKL